MGSLIAGRDEGGVRWFLDDRPVHCGTVLELRLPERGGEPVWTSVRFEMEFPAGGSTRPLRAPDDQIPVLYLHLGHRWERRFRAVPAASVAAVRPDHPPGTWIVFDERRGRAVTLSAREAPDEDHPEGRLVYSAALGDVDGWRSQGEAERVARELAAYLDGYPTVSIPLPDPSRAELRWPGGSAS